MRRLSRTAIEDQRQVSVANAQNRKYTTIKRLFTTKLS